MSHSKNCSYQGSTLIASSTGPWDLYRPLGHRLLCSDGVVRAAKMASTADSFFSVPASVRVNGKHVSGYMTSEETGEGPDLRAYVFRHHDRHKDKLPPWPSKFTPEHTRLIASVHEEYDT